MVSKREISTWVVKLGPMTLWLLFLFAPFVFSTTARENFRMPKLFFSECLGLASVVFLVWRLRGQQRVDWRGFFKQPVVVAILPMLIVATSGLITSDHSSHVQSALVSLWIGAACLVAWSLTLRAAEIRDLLDGLIVPALLLSIVGILQFHHIFNPFEFEGPVADRIGLTSFAGGAFDLAAYLVLPCLLVQATLRRQHDVLWRRVMMLAAATSIYMLIATQTLTAIASFVLATLVLWFLLLPKRKFLTVAAAVGVILLVAGLAVEPLRVRLDNKLQSFQEGNLNRVLSGRLDGWTAAWWMLENHLWTGVGHGAFRAEFGYAKHAMRNEGHEFHRWPKTVYFINAHSDPLATIRIHVVVSHCTFALPAVVFSHHQGRLCTAIVQNNGRV
ncbi:MAG: O-antigen ligase family protein, partial [Acidobacteriota bacterium]